jgi:hypothetical protein
MTQEQSFTLWITALTALPTIAFTGVVAYWTWRRDQERIIVQKVPLNWETLDETESEATLCGIGILVTNLSLFPVRISGLAFRFKGTSYPIDRDWHRDEWTPEIASHARMVIYSTDAEWAKLVDAIGNRGRILESKFVAVAKTETGRRFASNRLIVQIMQPLRTIRRWFGGKA